MHSQHKLINLYTFLTLCRTNVVMNYTEIEGKVREATNDEPWGPTGPLMQELAHATFTYEHFPEVMSMLWRRMLQDNKTNWRRTYKVQKISSRDPAISFVIITGCNTSFALLSAKFHIWLFMIYTHFARLSKKH